MGRRSQRKGAEGERELAAALSELLGTPCQRASAMYLPGIIAPDVLIAGDQLHIEAKRREKVCLPAALRQARADARPHQVAIVAHRPNRCGWMVTIDLRDLVRLARAVGRTVGPGAVDDKGGADGREKGGFRAIDQATAEAGTGEPLRAPHLQRLADVRQADPGPTTAARRNDATPKKGESPE